MEHDGSTVHSGVWAMVAVRGMVQCETWCILSMGEAEIGGSQELSDPCPRREIPSNETEQMVPEE